VIVIVTAETAGIETIAIEVRATLVMEKRKVRISPLRRRAEATAPWTRMLWIMPAHPPRREMAKIPLAKEGGVEVGIAIAAGKFCVVKLIS
jgi:hypothetical protein